jgi:hypothetical protein
LKQFPTVGQSIADAVTLEEWNGTEAEHAEYLKSNPKWWMMKLFWRVEMLNTEKSKL